MVSPGYGFTRLSFALIIAMVLKCEARGIVEGSSIYKFNARLLVLAHFNHVVALPNNASMFQKIDSLAIHCRYLSSLHALVILALFGNPIP
jgi:hypothetical protein